MRPTINVWASGSKIGGASGFENLVRHSRILGGDLDADIVGVISDIDEGGVKARANKLRIPFHYFPKPWTAERYREKAVACGGEWNAFSGWMKLMKGLAPETSFNIHPARLVILRPDGTPRFGGKGRVKETFVRLIFMYRGSTTS